MRAAPLAEYTESASYGTDAAGSYIPEGLSSRPTVTASTRIRKSKKPDVINRHKAGIASGQQMVLWTFAVSGALWRSEPSGVASPLA